MRTQVLKYWDRVRTSFWFLPSLMTCAAVLLALATVALDESVDAEWVLTLSWAYTGGAEGASAVLGTIAGSMITIAGVVFSLTLVALSLASSQFGPRLLRNFMRDTVNQLVLGTFIATFLYCLLVLRTIRRVDESAFVPHLSVTLGVAFAVASLGVLIYFIHHVSVSIQADEIIARVASELLDGIDRLFPKQIGEAKPLSGPGDGPLPRDFDRDARVVESTGDGYLQIIDAAVLMARAVDADAILRLERRPGQYVVRGSALASVWPGERLTDELAAQINSAFVLGSQRTDAQDIEFAIHQLVEIAVRALSPGVNDPFTAITCVDRLGSALCRLAQRDRPAPCRYDEHDRLRIVAPPVAFPEILDAAFNQIRQYSRSSAAVAIRLLETIIVIAAMAKRPDDRDALWRHADMIARGAREGLPEARDRQVVEERYEVLLHDLGGASRSPVAADSPPKRPSAS